MEHRHAGTGVQSVEEGPDRRENPPSAGRGAGKTLPAGECKSPSQFHIAVVESIGVVFSMCFFDLMINGLYVCLSA